MTSVSAPGIALVPLEEAMFTFIFALFTVVGVDPHRGVVANSRMTAIPSEKKNTHHLKIIRRQWLI